MMKLIASTELERVRTDAKRRLERLVMPRVHIRRDNGWIHAGGEPVWVIHCGNWFRYTVGGDEHDAMWRFARFIGAA